MILPKTLLFVVIAGLLAACAGFEPLYADNSGNGVARFGGMSLAPVEGRAGFLFSQAVRERGDVHEGNSGAYVLHTTLTKNLTAVGVRVDQVATRSRMTVTANYVLRDRSGVIIYQGQARSMAAYDQPDQPYGALAAAQDAEERATRVLAEKVLNDVAVFFKTKAKTS